MNDSFVVQGIGTVRNGRNDASDADWGALESAIELAPVYAGGLDGLGDWSHALIVFHMHRGDAGETPPEGWRRRPRGLADMPMLGVFAQRGRMRPNPIGVTTVRIVRVEPGRLTVRGLDAVDGTPVLDIKPWAAAFDAARDPREPEWFTRLMRGYF